MNQIFVHDCSGYKNSELFRVLGITVWTVGHTGDSGYEGLPAVGPGHPYGICPIPGVWCHGLWLVLEVVFVLWWCLYLLYVLEWWVYQC